MKTQLLFYASGRLTAYGQRVSDRLMDRTMDQLARGIDALRPDAWRQTVRVTVEFTATPPDA
jgi:hypothetical protein